MIKKISILVFAFSVHVIFAFEKPDSSIHSERLFFETTETASADQIIRDHLIEQFPIISEHDINEIILSKLMLTENE